MRFNQPTDYSPGTGNTVLLRCQLSSCHPPSQHMGCVRSKKAAEQLSAEFLPPCPLQLSEVIGAPGSSQSCLQQCREYKVRQEHRKGMTLPLLPGLSISAWFKGSSWAQENTLYHMQPKTKFYKMFMPLMEECTANHEWSDTFCLPISFFSFTSSAVKLS